LAIARLSCALVPGPARILHLAAGNLFGGVETLLCTFAQRRSAQALDSEFGLCFEGRLSDELRRLGAPVHMLGRLRLRDALSVGRANLALSRLLRRARYDAVVMHGAWPHLAFGLCTKLHGVKLVTWGHGAPLELGLLDRLSDWVRADLLIANSHHTLEALGSRFEKVRSEVIYYPVEVDAPSEKSRASIRRELVTPEGAVVIAFAARLERWKGHALLLRAVRELAQHVQTEWRVWLCGGAQRPHEQAYLRELTGFVEQAGLSSRISFLGQRTDVRDVLRAADIFCQPNSAPEPFGIVFIEALYAGLPVVTTNMGGGKEIVDQSCGLLVEPEPTRVAAALGRLITDPGLRQRLAQAAPARARRLCDPDTRIEEIAGAILRASPTRGARRILRSGDARGRPS
jgi:glycosyltransferase involved in cell wall biosynthesis